MPAVEEAKGALWVPGSPGSPISTRVERGDPPGWTGCRAALLTEVLLEEVDLKEPVEELEACHIQPSGETDAAGECHRTALCHTHGSTKAAPLGGEVSA